MIMQANMMDKMKAKMNRMKAKMEIMKTKMEMMKSKWILKTSVKLNIRKYKLLKKFLSFIFTNISAFFFVGLRDPSWQGVYTC